MYVEIFIQQLEHGRLFIYLRNCPLPEKTQRHIESAKQDFYEVRSLLFGNSMIVKSRQVP
jgi:hypothetical protein